MKSLLEWKEEKKPKSMLQKTESIMANWRLSQEQPVCRQENTEDSAVRGQKRELRAKNWQVFHEAETIESGREGKTIEIIKDKEHTTGQGSLNSRQRR